ncbi:hypothetical protein QQF64_006708 [Cirrhinus molitorella]|uniref:Peptidase A2 domain-containing protein n=1 Tax=Cirrhinus molitorella TaxID=172907 RepID=A0ABR3M8K9_9TELE
MSSLLSAAGAALPVTLLTNMCHLGNVSTGTHCSSGIAHNHGPARLIWKDIGFSGNPCLFSNLTAKVNAPSPQGRTVPVLWCCGPPYLYLSHLSSSPSICVLIDSGASGNFISSHSLKRFQRPYLPSNNIYQITTIQGKPLGRGLVRHRTPEIQLQIGIFHVEHLSLLVLEEATVDIVLGCPWLILQWTSFCHLHCLKDLPKPTTSASKLTVCSTSVESPQPVKEPSIPPVYRAFQDVFSKIAATRLPPHRPWDSAIDLLPGAKLPEGQIYPLSIPERAAMEEYIQEALHQGFIRPSTSPAASSFFV